MNFLPNRHSLPLAQGDGTGINACCHSHSLDFFFIHTPSSPFFSNQKLLGNSFSLSFNIWLKEGLTIISPYWPRIVESVFKLNQSESTSVPAMSAGREVGGKSSLLSGGLVWKWSELRSCWWHAGEKDDEWWRAAEARYSMLLLVLALPHPPQVCEPLYWPHSSCISASISHNDPDSYKGLLHLKSIFGEKKSKVRVQALSVN